MNWGFAKYGGSGWTAFAGWLAATAAFFLILATFDFVIPSIMNSYRLANARRLADAMASYRRDHGGFPVNAGNSVQVLYPALVGGRYIDALPSEPFAVWRQGIDYLYRATGPQYGVLVPLQSVELFGYSVNQGSCMIGDDTTASVYWGNPPQCPI
jgi:hypothetical protein